MNDELRFKQLVIEFSALVHKKYFSSIQPSDWTLHAPFSNHYRFGYQADKFFNSPFVIPDHPLFSLNVHYNNGIISFYVEREKEEDKQHYQSIANDFTKLTEASGLNVLLRINPSISSLFKPSPLNIVAFGEKAKKVLPLLETFSNDDRVTFSNFTIYMETGSFSNRKVYYITPEFSNISTPSLRLSKNQSSVYKNPILLSTVESIRDFLDMLEMDAMLIKNSIEDIVNKVKKFDITCYYDEKKGSLFIFNQRTPFYIGVNPENGKFRVRFGEGYNQGSDLLAIMGKVETKAMNLIKKKRLKAAVSGGASDTLSKFLFRILGYPVNGFHFNKLFHSTLSEGDLNKKLLMTIDDEMELLDENHCLYYQTYLRSIADRHQIKTGKKLNDLYIFVSGTKIYILTKEEFDDIQINETSFKQKKDRTLVNELKEWKTTVNI